MGDRHVSCTLWRESDHQNQYLTHCDGDLILFHSVFGLACLVEVGDLRCSQRLCKHVLLYSQAIQWPQGGEIDTFEGVNLQTNNQMSLHTESVRTFYPSVERFSHFPSLGMHASLTQRNVDPRHQHQLCL